MAAPRAPARRAPAGALLLPAALLTGCATYVTIHHVVPPDRLASGAVARLSRLAIVMRLDPPDRPAGLLQQAAKNVLEAAKRRAAEEEWAVSYALPRPEALSLLGAASRVMRSPYGRVVGTFVEGPSATLFLDALGATAVLRLTPSRVAAAQTQVRRKTRDGGTVTVYELATEFVVRYELAAWPEGTVLARGGFSHPASAIAREPVDLKRWVLEQDGIRRAWLSGLRTDLLPVPVARIRKLQKGRTPGAKAASKLARRGRWEEARPAWEESGGFRAAWNLGLYHERRGEWRLAAGRYREARAAAEKPSARRALDGYLDQLDRQFVAAGAAEDGGGDWFDRVVAVAPFANETTNLAASDKVREEVVDTLKRKGYAVLAPEETDRRLRDLGVSEGAHLKAFPADRIVAAAGSHLVLGGTVTEYRNVNVGVYHMNVVGVGLELMDAEGRVPWTAEGYGYHDAFVRPQDAGQAFVGGLIGKALTKAVGLYLTEETEAAVRNAMESLPARPPE